MALLPTIKTSPAPTSTAASKTRAKQRYLRRKKEKRKHKKSGPGSSGAPKKDSEDTHTNSDVDDSQEDEYEDEEASEDVDDLTHQDKTGNRKQRASSRPPVEETIKPAKKRRKLSSEPEQPEGARADPVQQPIDPVLDEAAPPRSPSPVSPSALPVFSAPRPPDAPSKSVLALQGLDPALLNAQVINSTTISPLNVEGEDQLRLNSRTRRRLQELGITELFAVQTALLPFMLPGDSMQRALYQPYDPPRDVCVSAPTGSGKTLAYVIPITEILAKRTIVRLRALIVLPTRDLVTQVRETFEAVAKGQGLKIGTATGQHSFAHEQVQLVQERNIGLAGGSSKIDILICTPGRLIDHLNGTKNFTLQHLRFLVIDEADRLLASSFQDWLAQVLSATRPVSMSSSLLSGSQIATDQYMLPCPDALSPTSLDPAVRTDVDEIKHSSCQKLLFSATLTRDPAKLASLGLRDTKYFIVQSPVVTSANDDTAGDGIMDVVMERFSVPATLTEHMLTCSPSDKPLMLFHLVHVHNVRNALVFTKSAEATERLEKLFRFFEDSIASSSNNHEQKPVVVRSYSSDLGSSERKTILDSFKAQEINVLICSDLISRGIDINHVRHVVSYDAPVDMRKYVHRVGRTARAGREGDAWTLVEDQEARYFKNLLQEAGHLPRVKRMRVKEADTSGLMPHYEAALKQLKEVYIR